MEQQAYLILIKQVTKTFESKAGVFTALRQVNLDIKGGEFVTIIGKSGSGKSTLLNIVAGIDRPTSGEVIVSGTSVHTLNESQTAVWRGKTIGVVFQFFQLLPTLTVIENVMLPMDFCRTYPFQERQPRAMKLLERVGMTEHAGKLPSTLSGGEQQRVAFCRALANDPPIIVADEPTGNLDSQTAEKVMGLFGGLARDGKTVIMVTHERNNTPGAARKIVLNDGAIMSDTGASNRREEHA
ncbi:MAG: ABC transporter ATP-binding protein [Deltaproteobacteria bacterium RBG_13_53_10]|nr:MAG: ABC transporter ATP-binding protein [Deltaproteobacteria bacterium RBG_13_53_10]